MPARSLVAIAFLALIVWFNSCSSGLGNDPRRRTPTPTPTATSSNLPVGVDLGVTPTDPAAEPAITNVVIPAYGSQAARDVVLLAFSTAAAANDADGAGNPLTRDTVTDGNSASDVFLAAVCAQDIETRAFSQALAGKFRHPRCTTCHSMQAATTQAFVSSPLPHAGPPPGPTFPNNDPATCAPCHVGSTEFPVEGWQAPAASFDMRTETVAQIADRATRIPAGDTEHFVSDKRVLWALDSGILPTVGGRNGRADDNHNGILEPEDTDGTPRTVPGGSVRFIQQIQDWNASGRVVTAAAAVKDVTLMSRATGGTAAGNGASRRPNLKFVANGSFNGTSVKTVGTVVVVFESDATDLTAGDGNSATDVYLAVAQLRVDEDPATGAALAGGLNLVFVNGSSEIVSARNGTSSAGNGASTRPSIGGTSGDVVAFQSVATDLVAGFTNANAAGADVYVRNTTGNTTLLVSHAIGNAATSGDGASENPAIDATGVAVAFESDATDLIGADLNALRDVFHTRIDSGSPFTKVRSSVSDTGAEATGGASSNASIQVVGARALVAFQSDATNLAPALTAATNVFLFDSSNGSGAATLLNQRVSPTGNAIGNGNADSPQITPDASRVVFASAANNIDVVRGTDINYASDLFLVEVAQLAAGNVLPFRVSVTNGEAADANGASSGASVGSFGGSSAYQAGAIAYVTTATNLGTSDSTRIMVSFLNETSGVFADFTASAARGAVPLAITFTDTSTGTPTSWAWDFDNDGTVDSTQQNPTFTFTTPGTYTVKLTATNANSSGEKVATDLVLAVGTIVPDFTASTTSGPSTLTVNFTDTSTQSPTSWAWDFGDGGNSTAQNPSHGYTTPGTYTVSLTATNEAGAQTVTKTNFISVFTPVVAGFTASPTVGIAPFTVTFTNTSTGATTYSWDFGDGGNSTAQNPTHDYTIGGSYTVTLTATGPGGTDTDTVGITANSAVTPSFTMQVSGANITSAYSTTSITFTSTSTGSINSYAWDFDNNPGTTESTLSSVTRTFNSVSSVTAFTIRLTVSGPGGTAFTTQALTIVPISESLAITASGDSTIYQGATGNSNGAGTTMVVGRPVGTTVPGEAAFARRGLVKFSLSGIPASSTILSATLQLTSDTPVATGAQTINVHRLTRFWTEGSASGAGGVGAAPAGGGATWANSSFATTWTSAGGDFAASASGSLSVNAPGTHTSTSLLTDVQNWFSGANSNFGWLLKNSSEASSGTVKRFHTSEETTPVAPPTLNVTFRRPLP